MKENYSLLNLINSMSYRLCCPQSLRAQVKKPQVKKPPRQRQATFCCGLSSLQRKVEISLQRDGIGTGLKKRMNKFMQNIMLYLTCLLRGRLICRSNFKPLFKYPLFRRTMFGLFALDGAITIFAHLKNSAKKSILIKKKKKEINCINFQLH